MNEQNKVVPLKRPESSSNDSRMIVTMTMVELREVIREAVAAELAAAKTGGAPLLSSAEVSKQWNVPRTWIEEAGRAGKLPRVVIGSYIRFKVEDIERFIEENRKAKN